MMKQNLTFPALALAGGAAAFVFRLLQVRTGFEADTGLPIPGNPWGLILIVLLILVAAALALLAWKLPPEPTAPAFPQAFSTTSTGTLTILIMGVFLLGVSGVLDLFSGLSAGTSLPADAYAITADGVSQSSFSAKEHLILGLLTLLSAVSLFPAAAVCRRPGSHEPSAAPRRTVQGNLLLVPVVCLVVRLVLIYRVDSIDPVLSDYYLELLALVFLTLGFLPGSPPSPSAQDGPTASPCTQGWPWCCAWDCSQGQRWRRRRQPTSRSLLPISSPAVSTTW